MWPNLSLLLLSVTYLFRTRAALKDNRLIGKHIIFIFVSIANILIRKAGFLSIFSVANIFVNDKISNKKYIFTCI